MCLYVLLNCLQWLSVPCAVLCLFGAYRFFKPSRKRLRAYMAFLPVPLHAVGWSALIATIALVIGFLVVKFGSLSIKSFAEAITWCSLCCALVVAYVAATRVWFDRRQHVTYIFKRESNRVISLHISLNIMRAYNTARESSISNRTLVQGLLHDAPSIVEILKTAPAEVEYIEVMSPWFADQSHGVVLRRLKKAFSRSAPHSSQTHASRIMPAWETWYVMKTSAQAKTWSAAVRTNEAGGQVLETAGFRLHRPAGSWTSL
jgi:hypothetical protein